MGDLSASTLRRRNRIAVWAIRFFGALSLRTNRVIGSLIGWLLIILPNGHKHATHVNLDICFPQMTLAQRRQLARQSLMETGKGTLEVAYIWRRPQKALALIRQTHGAEPLLSAVANHQAVIILAPHLGCWELLNYWLSTHFTVHTLFNPSGLEQVDQLIAASRETFSTHTYPATKRGVVGLVRALKEGNVTAILPDQVPERKSTHFAPFFGHPASTPSLACRLIKQSHGLAFTCFAKRLPGTQGYDIVIQPADEQIYHDDLDIALGAMNRSLERLIMEAPEQYLWSYKRFRRRQNNTPNPYKTPSGR